MYTNTKEKSEYYNSMCYMTFLCQGKAWVGAYWIECWYDLEKKNVIFQKRNAHIRLNLVVLLAQLYNPVIILLNIEDPEDTWEKSF